MHPALIPAVLGTITLIAYLIHRRYLVILGDELQANPTTLGLRNRIRKHNSASYYLATATSLLFFATYYLYSLNQPR